MVVVVAAIAVAVVAVVAAAVTAVVAIPSMPLAAQVVVPVVVIVVPVVVVVVAPVFVVAPVLVHRQARARAGRVGMIQLGGLREEAKADARLLHDLWNHTCALASTMPNTMGTRPGPPMVVHTTTVRSHGGVHDRWSPHAMRNRKQRH
jgi:hypothetical protein